MVAFLAINFRCFVWAWCSALFGGGSAIAGVRNFCWGFRFPSYVVFQLIMSCRGYVSQRRGYTQIIGGLPGLGCLLMGRSLLPRICSGIVTTGTCLTSNRTPGTARTTGVTNVSESTCCGCGSNIFRCGPRGDNRVLALSLGLGSGGNILSTILDFLCRLKTGILSVGRDIPRGKITTIALAIFATRVATSVRTLSTKLDRVGNIDTMDVGWVKNVCL